VRVLLLEGDTGDIGKSLGWYEGAIEKLPSSSAAP
jgi:hypothetical protein